MILVYAPLIGGIATFAAITSEALGHWLNEREDRRSLREFLWNVKG